MADQETIAERIIKLLAKAEGASTPEEAEAFFAKAAALQSKHAIDEIMLNAAAGKNVDDITEKMFQFKGGYAKANLSMLHDLAEVLGCKTIYTDFGNNDLRVRVHGFRSDLERLDILFTSLLIQATRALKPWAKNHPDMAWATAAEKYQLRKSFLIGFGQGAAGKLRESMTVAVKEASEPGVGLVLVDRKTQVEEAYRQAHPRVRQGRGTKTVYGGTSAGRAAGRQSDIGQRGAGSGSSGALRG